MIEPGGDALSSGRHGSTRGGGLMRSGPTPHCARPVGAILYDQPIVLNRRQAGRCHRRRLAPAPGCASSSAVAGRHAWFHAISRWRLPSFVGFDLCPPGLAGLWKKTKALSAERALEIPQILQPIVAGPKNGVPPRDRPAVGRACLSAQRPSVQARLGLGDRGALTASVRPPPAIPSTNARRCIGEATPHPLSLRLPQQPCFSAWRSSDLLKPGRGRSTSPSGAPIHNGMITAKTGRRQQKNSAPSRGP